MVEIGKTPHNTRTQKMENDNNSVNKKVDNVHGAMAIPSLGNSISPLTLEEDIPGRMAKISSSQSSVLEATKNDTSTDVGTSELDLGDQPSHNSNSSNKIISWWDRTLIDAMSEAEQEADKILFQESRPVTRPTSKRIRKTGNECNKILYNYILTMPSIDVL